MTVANVNVTKVLFKRGNTVQNNNYTGVSGEISIDTQTKTLRVHDGITPGGNILTTGGIYGNSNVTTYLTSVAGNIIPAANVTYSLGNSTNQWRDLWVSNNTIYIGNVPITVSNGNLLINGNSVTGGTGTDDVLGANVGAYQTYANANAATQATSINSINANIGAYQTYSNANAATQTTSIDFINANVTAANSAIQTLSANIGTLVSGAPAALDTLLELGNALGNSDSFSSTMVNWLGNITSNVTAANTSINTINANVGAYQIYANANAATQSTSIDSINSNVTAANSSINTFNANLGAFQTYANLHFLDSSYGNSNVASYLPTYSGDIAANIVKNGYTWTFGAAGTTTLPAGGTITEGGGLTGAIKLTPTGGANSNQALLIYPTGAADGDHIHLTAGGGSTELYLGNDYHYVKLVDGGNIELRATTANLSSQAAWTFDTTGNVDTIQALGIKVPNGVPSSVTAIASTTGSWESNPRSNLATTGGSGSGLTVNVTETGGYASTIAIATAGTGYTNGDFITVVSGTSTAYFTIAVAGRNTWNFGTDGRLTFPGNLVIAGNTSVFGTDAALIQTTDNRPLLALSSGANGAVSSIWVEDVANVGTSNIAAVYANPTVGSGIVRIAVGQNGVGSGPNLWDFGTGGNLTLPETGYLRVGTGIVAGFASSPAPVISGFSSVSAENFRFQGNGVNILSTVGGTYSNTNVAAYLSTITSGNVGAGNLTVINNFSSNVITANSFTYANGVNILSTISAGSTYSNVNVEAYIGGNIGAYQIYANANLGTATTNITTLFSNAATQATAINTINANLGTATTNITTLFSNAATQAASIDTINANVGAYQTFANANAATQATSINTVNANIGAYQTYANTTFTYSNTNVAAYLTTATITTTGNITAGNLTTSGTFTVANITTTGTYGNITGANVVSANTVSATNYLFANGVNILSTVTYGNTQANALLSSNTVSTINTTGNIVTIANVIATTFRFANGVNILSTVTAGSTYSNANVATFLAAYGSNTISTTGNITAGNVSATNFVGNGVGLTNVTVSAAGNIVGTSSNVTLVAGNYSYTFDNTGNVTLPANVFVGVTNTFLPNTVTSFSSNVNYYSQVTLQNKSSGNDATADYIVTANNGSDTVNFLDLGIINSGYDNTTPSNSLGNIVFAADSYIYAQGNTSNANQSGGNLAIGTSTTGKAIKFFAGGTTSSAIAMTVANTGVTVSSNLTTNRLTTVTGIFWSNGTAWSSSGGSGTDDVLRANVGAYQIYANANLGTATTNISTINANVGAYQIYANANLGTATTNISTINANIGSYQIYANANLGTATTNITTLFSNAATQATSINSINANVGAFQLYANANIGTLFNGNTSTNANIGAFQAYANANVAALRTSITSLATGANTNTAAYLAAGISTNITTTGNVSAGNVIVNGQPTTYGYVNTTVVANTSPVASTNVNGGSSVSPALTILTVAIPSAGTWRLDAEMRVYIPGEGYMAAAFYDNGTLISGSEYFIAAGGVTQTGAATGQYGGFMSYNLTTTGARTVTLGAWATTNSQFITSDDGRTWARATLLNPSIAVQATATGTINNQYASITNSTDISITNGVAKDVTFDTITASSGIPYNTSTGVFTLTSGVTYRFTGELSFAGYTGYALYQLVDATTNTPINGQISANPSYNSGFAEANNNTYDAIYTPSTNQTVKFRITGSSFTGTGVIRGGYYGRITVQQINNAFALNALETMTTTGNVSVGGNLSVSGTFSGSGSGLTGVALKTTGSWTVTTGTNTYSFTVPASGTYQLWVDCNIPNGILVWNATATVTNTNVPVVGAQYAWVYNGGGSPIDFTSIPNQFTGTGNTIVRSSVAPSANTNRFDFGLNNTSGGNVTVRYGWVAIS